MTRRAREPCPAAATNRELHQLGDRCGSANATIQVAIAAHGFALAVLAVVVAIVIAGMVGLGREAKGIRFGGAFARS
jgi:hypothetical protein